MTLAGFTLIVGFSMVFGVVVASWFSDRGMGHDSAVAMGLVATVAMIVLGIMTHKAVVGWESGPETRDRMTSLCTDHGGVWLARAQACLARDAVIDINPEPTP